MHRNVPNIFSKVLGKNFGLATQILFELCQQVEEAIFSDEEDDQDPFNDTEKKTECSQEFEESDLLNEKEISDTAHNFHNEIMEPKLDSFDVDVDTMCLL